MLDFIFEKNEIISYFYEDTFLYNIGYLKTKPNIIKVRTKRVTFREHYNAVYWPPNCKVVLSKYICPDLNERNILFLPIIDLFMIRNFTNNIELSNFIYAYLTEYNINAQEIEECLVYYPERTQKHVRKFLKEREITYY